MTDTTNNLLPTDTSDMITILIEKDSATKVAKLVKDLDEARGYEFRGFNVQLVNADGSLSPLPKAPEPRAPRAPSPAQARHDAADFADEQAAERAAEKKFPTHK